MQVIHIISSLSKINFGIWNAALFSSSWLLENFAINTRVWICEHSPDTVESLHDLQITYLDQQTLSDITFLLKEQSLTKDNSIFVSHGCWLQPTRLGHELSRLGFQWLYVPHGMLEPWSLKQSKIKKFLYYFFYEGRLNKAAARVRAVSEEEQKNLSHKLNRQVDLVENGVRVMPFTEKTQGPYIFLFMARLHFKKGIVPLVKAWSKIMRDDPQKKLIIAGPDEGELKNIEPFIKGNVQYAGAVYGEDKIQLLRQAHYYMLPSFSEGFPTSVLDAMSYGLIPLISRGCNFNHVFSQGLGYQIEPEIESIESVLLKLKDMKFDSALSSRNHEFILNRYSEECIGRKLFNLYADMINTKEVSLI